MYLLCGPGVNTRAVLMYTLVAYGEPVTLDHGDNVRTLSQMRRWYTPWQAVTKISADFVLDQ